MRLSDYKSRNTLNPFLIKMLLLLLDILEKLTLSFFNYLSTSNVFKKRRLSNRNVNTKAEINFSKFIKSFAEMWSGKTLFNSRTLKHSVLCELTFLIS